MKRKELIRKLRIEDEITSPSCLSFGPSSALRKRTNTISMRPYTRLEDEPKSFAILVNLFRPRSLKGESAFYSGQVQDTIFI